jgi:Ca2+-binding RTX toxin-like protein
MTITLGDTATGLTSNNVSTGSGADDITGGSGADTISSGDGADTIIAGSGNDSIDAGDGTDDIDMGAGNDILTYSTGHGGDADTIDGGAGTDTIVSAAAMDLSSVVWIGGNLTDSGIERITIKEGTDLTILGTALSGTAVAINEAAIGTTELTVTVGGSDTVDLSNLTFAAYTNGNAFDTGADVIDINVANGGDVTGTSLADTIDITTAGTADGGGGADTITGGSGGDSIVGGAGDDSILGGQGADTITGGAGNDHIDLDVTDNVIDTVIIAFGGEGQDTIVDFEIGTDIIDFSGTSDVDSVTNDTNDLVVIANGAAGDGDDTITANAGLVIVDNTNQSAAALDTASIAAYLADFDLAGTAEVDNLAYENTDSVIYGVVSDGTDAVLFKADATGNNDTVIDAAEITIIGTFDGMTDTSALDATAFADFT